jgi:GNAT superfamily N-acetyltransferase
MADFSLQPIGPEHRELVRRVWNERWGGLTMVVHGRVYQADQLPGLLAFAGEELLGAATYQLEGGECEVMSLDSFREGAGVGTALLRAVVDLARAQGCRRLFLITTNDNINALRFYQKRGLRLAALRPDAVTRARALKPGIPLLGDHGIPIRDELELELALG